jgi:hypothetical protein
MKNGQFCYSYKNCEEPALPQCNYLTNSVATFSISTMLRTSGMNQTLPYLHVTHSYPNQFKNF